MKDRIQWHWFVWGKHPGMADFVWAGTRSVLFQNFSKWVVNGFSKVDAPLKKKSRHCSWRFWSRGPSEEIVCGLVRNSCDSYGRSFPLLCLGAGKLADWPRNSSLLPFALETVWKDFEYMAAARYESIRALNDTLKLLKPPEPLWRQFQMRIYRAPNLYRQDDFDMQVMDGNRLCRVECALSENLPQDPSFCSNLVASTGNSGPIAVFIGEVGGRIAVAMIDDMLKPADFVWLWSMQAETKNNTETDRSDRIGKDRTNGI